MTRLLLMPVGGLPAEFHARLSTPQVRSILADYEQRNGDPALLRGLLYQLFEPFDPTATSVPRSFKTTLRRCRKNLTALLDFKIDNVRGHPLFLLSSAEQTVQAIDSALRILETKRTRGRPKAPGGATTDSLVVAFLAQEFTRVSGEPHYEWISTLVQAVAPEIFTPTYSSPRHLQDRANSVPPSALQELEDEARAFLSAGSFARTKKKPQEKIR